MWKLVIIIHYVYTLDLYSTQASFYSATRISLHAQWPTKDKTKTEEVVKEYATFKVIDNRNIDKLEIIQRSYLHDH